MTEDENKTKAQLIAELKHIRKRLAKVEVDNGFSQSTDDKFRLLTENSVTGIFIVQDAKLAYVNSSMARMLGYEPEEIVGKLTLKDLVHPDDIQVAMQRMRERLAGKIEEHNIAYKSVKKDGSLIYVEVYGMRTEFDGKPAVMGTLFDVTRRKKAEEALLESEGKFRSITETAVDYIFIKDEARKYTFVNKAMMDLIGLPENEILGKTPEEVFGAGEGCIIRKVDDRSFAGETVNETRTLTIGGNKRSFNTIQTPLTTAEGKVTSIMGIVRDVTEHKIAEDKLRSSEEISRNLIENSPDIITIHDLDGKLISVNHVVKGYKKEDVIGMYASDFVPMEYKQAHDKAFMNAAEENSPGTVEFSDSMNNHFLCRYFPFQQIHGAKSVMGITTDITERKMAEETLQQEHDMFMHGPTVVLKWLAEDNWPVDYVSSNIRKMLGYEPEDLTSGRVQYVNCIHPEDISRIEMEIGEYVESGINYYEQEYRLAGADGKYHWLHDSTTVVRDTSGKVKHFRGYILDITERKRTEIALQEALKFREKLISEVPVGISIYDTESGQCIACNKAIAELIGAIEEQVLAQNFYTIESWKKSGMLETAKSALKDNAKKELDVDVTSTFGKEICFHCYFVPFMAGNKRYLLFTLNDLTERRKMEEQLRQSEKMQAIGQLAGGIAHDFNNQLAAIVGYADLLREELSNSVELSHYADNILRATKRASGLTSQLLAFARKGKYLSVTIDIHKIIGEVVDILQRTISRRIVIKQHLEAQLVQVQGDPTQIQNAIMNIALNARDAMPDGGEMKFATSIAHLDAEYCKTNPYDTRPGSFIQVSVTDNGTGIDKETQKKIFEPFYTTKEPGKGTGMGLASVYGTAKTHGGSIEVDSQPERGTTMVLYLPLISSDAASEKVPEMRTDPGKGNAHILLVDDEEFVVDSASMMLETSGYQVSICRNGREAVIYYRDNWKAIDLVLLDMVMPEMDGRETFAEMKKMNPQIKALLSSGYSINGEAQEILNEGVAGFIQKPYLRIELIEKVASILK